MYQASRVRRSVEFPLQPLPAFHIRSYLIGHRARHWRGVSGTSLVFGNSSSSGELQYWKLLPYSAQSSVFQRYIPNNRVRYYHGGRKVPATMQGADKTGKQTNPKRTPRRPAEQSISFVTKTSIQRRSLLASYPLSEAYIRWPAYTYSTRWVGVQSSSLSLLLGRRQQYM